MNGVEKVRLREGAPGEIKGGCSWDKIGNLSLLHTRVCTVPTHWQEPSSFSPSFQTVMWCLMNYQSFCSSVRLAHTFLQRRVEEQAFLSLHQLVIGTGQSPSLPQAKGWLRKALVVYPVLLGSGWGNLGGIITCTACVLVELNFEHSMDQHFAEFPRSPYACMEPNYYFTTSSGNLYVK